MPRQTTSLITRPRTNEEFFESFRKTLHGLASGGKDWEGFPAIERAFSRNAKAMGSLLTGGTQRVPLVIKRSDSLRYEISYLDWINWWKPQPDGSYNHTVHAQVAPKSVTIISGKSYDAPMIELIYNFEARKFEVWINTNLATATTRRHMSKFMSALSSVARSRYDVVLGEGERTLRAPLYRFDMGEYHNTLNSRSRYSGDIVNQMDTTMNSWRLALGRSIKKNTRHATVSRLLRLARDFAILARRNMTLDHEEALEQLRTLPAQTFPDQRWLHVVDKTHAEEAFYDMILEKPYEERKRMYNVFKELDA